METKFDKKPRKKSKASPHRRDRYKGGRSHVIGKLKCGGGKEMDDASKAFTTAADERVFKSFHLKLFSFSCLEVSSITFAASSALRTLVVAL